MARTNATRTRVQAATSQLVGLRVLRSERLSPTFVRVTLGDGDVERFVPLGLDQWFRLFLPVDDGTALSRLPAKLDTPAYLRYLTMATVSRPIMRSYSVRAFRPDGPDGPELDVDFVQHGSPDDGTAGPAATWSATCRPGDRVAIIDEGAMFNPAPGVAHVRLVADETGLPAVAGVLGSLDPGVSASVVVEVPHADDCLALPSAAEVDVTWLVRGRSGASVGALALDAVRRATPPAVPSYGWVLGEQALVAGTRRHWVSSGLPKDAITFCGYWKAPRSAHH